MAVTQTAELPIVSSFRFESLLRRPLARLFPDLHAVRSTSGKSSGWKSGPGSWPSAPAAWLRHRPLSPPVAVCRGVLHIGCRAAAGGSPSHWFFSLDARFV